MSENLIFEILEDGQILRVKAENPLDFAEFIKDHEDDCLTSFNPNSDKAFIDLTESYWVNGWGVLNAEDLGQMTQCLVIAREMITEDDGSHTLHGKAWSNIHNYQIVNPLDQILENGYYDFYLWDEFEGENFPSPYGL